LIAGDLVRFEPSYLYATSVDERPVAIVIDVINWEKMVVILYNGTVRRVGTSHVRQL